MMAEPAKEDLRLQELMSPRKDVLLVGAKKRRVSRRGYEMWASSDVQARHDGIVRVGMEGREGQETPTPRDKLQRA